MGQGSWPAPYPWITVGEGLVLGSMHAYRPTDAVDVKQSKLCTLTHLSEGKGSVRSTTPTHPS